MLRSILLGVSAALALSSAVAAQPAPLLGPVFQDHAVLQRDTPVRLWGQAGAGEAVSVRIGSTTASVVADNAGRWTAVLPPMPAGGSVEISIKAGSREQIVRDVLIGDVWLCSGQSNMEMEVRKVANSDTEIANAANDRLRLLNVPRAANALPQGVFSAPAPWAAASPASVREFSAVCLFFGQRQLAATGVPIGLINASWGGSVIQDWISRPALTAVGGYETGLEVLAGRAADPQKADAAWQKVMETWWTEKAPAPAGTPWSARDFNDSGWAQIRPTSFWEGLGVKDLKDFDGAAWFRTTITLTAEQAKSGGSFWLGAVDDLDTTWINGVRIGGMEGWDAKRVYRVPDGVLRPGANSIAVRVLDSGGGGGLWGAPDKRGLRFDGGAFAPVDPVWRYRIAASLEQLGAPPRAPWIAGAGLTNLYNGMIAPLGPYALKGFAWYQGESNVREPAAYAKLLPALIADWRARFEAPQAPFLTVQLAGFGAPATMPRNPAWANLRETQRQVMKADPQGGLAVAIDIGAPYDIHSTNKQEVGRRLSLQAQRLAGDKVTASGPEPLNARRTGQGVSVTFANADGGLLVYGSARPAGFELCDATVCRFVDATAEGATVHLTAPAGLTPTRVRYAWADSPLVNLYNAADLPAVPFEAAIE